MTSPSLGSLAGLLDLAGTFAFAVRGAMVGVRRGMDLFGVVVLAFLTAVAGGIMRDVLIGSLPPEALQSWRGLALAVAGGMLAFFFGRPLARLHWLVQHFDAVGLSIFAVTGANKALGHGMMPVMAAVLGMVSGVGGGIVRDVMAARIPTVLTSEVYAVAALVGAAIVAAGSALHVSSSDTTMLLGATLCLMLRVVALHRGWKLPAAPARPTEAVRVEAEFEVRG